MQLMPQTAKQVAAAYKMKYEMGRLVSDPLPTMSRSARPSWPSSCPAMTAPTYSRSWLTMRGRDAWRNGSKSLATRATNRLIPSTGSSKSHLPKRAITFKKSWKAHKFTVRLEEGRTHFQLVEDLRRGGPGKVPDLSDVAGSARLG